MAKRRTRKQKEKAKHSFAVSWKPSTLTSKPEAKKGKSEPIVKGQTTQAQKHKRDRHIKKKSADRLAKDEGLGTIKRDLVKSLIIASLILTLEVVLYLA